MSVQIVNNLNVDLLDKVGDYISVIKYQLDDINKHRKEIFKTNNLLFLYENKSCININKINCHVPI